MKHEISGKISSVLLRYAREHYPQLFEANFTDLDVLKLGNFNGWISYQALNSLYQIILVLVKPPENIFSISRQAVKRHVFGKNSIWMPRFVGLPRAFNWINQYWLQDGVSEIQVEDITAESAVIHRKMRSGFICTALDCQRLRGMLYGVLEAFGAYDVQIHETHCSVPLWEKGQLENSGFQIDAQQRLWRIDIASGQKKMQMDMNNHGEQFHMGTFYGSYECCYHLQWKVRHSLGTYLNGLLRKLLIIPQITELMLEQEKALERKNRRLHSMRETLHTLLEHQQTQILKLQVKNREQNEALSQMAIQLKEWNAMKYYFLSITSHEMRTPLTIVKGAINLLLNERHQLPPEKIEKYLRMADKNAERLIRILDDLLDFSRMEFGQLKLDLSAVDIVRLLRESMEEFREAALQKGCSMESEISANPPNLIGDGSRIKQIVNNLLSNAIKFTPRSGKIWIALQIAEKDLEITVQDNGVGIAKEEQDKIFRKFHRVENKLTRETSGMGLGLAIVKELVQLHDGKISVESEPGRGSKFTIQLPLAGPWDESKVQLKKDRTAKNES